MEAASLSPKQARSIVEADARVNIWHGSVSSGKTIASLIAWLEFVAHAPKQGKLVMVGKTLQTLERNVLDVMAEMFPARTKAVVHTNGAATATILGREVITIGANDARAEGRIRGMTVAGFYVDEATLLPDLGYWLQMLNRMRVPGARLFATTNPDNPTHWLKDRVIDRAVELGYREWSFGLEDNPALPPEYVEAIKRENTGLHYERNVEGRWVLAEGAIYDMFDARDPRYVVPDLPRLADGKLDIDQWIVAVDHGTTNPFVAVLIGVCHEEQRLYVARDWRHDPKLKGGTKMTNVALARALRGWLDGMVGDPQIGHVPYVDRVYVDPAAAEFRVQLWEDGWPVHGADNEVLAGIRSVASLRANGHLVIVGGEHGVSRESIGEVEGYVWDDKAAAKGEDRPVKQRDHYPDAERYGVRALRSTWRRWLSLPADAAEAA